MKFIPVLLEIYYFYKKELNNTRMFHCVFEVVKFRGTSHRILRYIITNGYKPLKNDF